MNAQTTIEFMIILIALMSFSIIIISKYTAIQHSQVAFFEGLKNTISTMPNASNINSSYNNYQMNITAYLQNITYINKSNNFDIIFSYPGNYKINNIIFATNNANIIPLNFSNINGSYIKIIQTSIIPENTGIIKTTIHTSVTIFSQNHQNITKTYNLSVSSYAEFEPSINSTNNTNSSQSLALIKDRNESIIYNLSSNENLTKAFMWSHCAYIDNSGEPKGEVQECGGNTYGFIENIFPFCDSGYFYIYYCVALKNISGAFIQNITNQQINAYKINLFINVSGIQGDSYLSNLKSTNELIEGNGTYGISSIKSVYNPAPYLNPNYVVLNKFNGRYIIYPTYYKNYINNLSSLQSILAIYNDSEVSGGNINYVSHEINIVNNYINKILNESSVNVTNCTINQNTFLCKSQYLFQYNITTQIFNKKINKTTDYEGSIIHII